MFEFGIRRYDAAALSAHDESPRVSAAVGRENAVRIHARLTSRWPAVPSAAATCVTRPSCGVQHVTFHITNHVYVVASPSPAPEGCLAERACRAARRSWMKPRGPAFSWYVRIVARTAFAVINNLYSVPAYVVWMMALRLVRPVYAPLYWTIEGLMYHWLLAMVSMWSWTAGYESKYVFKIRLWRVSGSKMKLLIVHLLNYE